MLSPGELPGAMKDQMNGDLPAGKTITDIFADFMRYLFDSAKAQFRSSESNGELKWRLVSKSIELVLTHPNGWGGPQQTQLRNAAVKAGIITDTYTGRSRVHFVSEGEASFKFCASHTHEGKNLKVCHTVPAQRRFLTHSQPGKQALIIDAGGGTIDITTYKVLSRIPLSIEELCEPKCELHPSQLQVFPFDGIRFRLGPRLGARYSESNSNGQRYFQTLRLRADGSTHNQRS